MTDLETYRPPTTNGAVQSWVPPVAATPVPETIATLRAWASTYAEVASFVAPLVDTPFIPESYRPQVPARASAEDHAAAREVAVATATAAVIYGAALGFDPLTALQNVYVVKGRPGLYAAAMVAIVQAAGHEIHTEEITDTRAVVAGRRHGRGQLERVEVTIDMARRAGWTSSNPQYGKDPQAMLWARAASRLCRHIAQDALKGLGASVEEMVDGDESAAAAPTVRTVTRAPLPGRPEPDEEKPKPTRARKKTAAAPTSPRPEGEAGLPPLPGEDDPGLDDAPAAADVPPLPGEDAVEYATSEQLAAIGAGLAERGITGPDRRVWVEHVVAHPIADPTHLTRPEADAVLAALAEPAFPAPDDIQDTLPVEDPPDGAS